MKPIPVRVPWMIRLESARGHPGQLRHENHDSGPKRYEHVGSHSRGFAHVGSLKPQDAAENDGHEKTDDDAGHLDAVGKTGNQLLPQSRA